MKKLLISLLIILLLVLAYFAIFNGITLGSFEILGYQAIQKENEELENRVTEASKITSVTFPEKMSTLTATAKQLTNTKEQYQDKIAYSSEENINRATQVKEYDLEFLYIRIGNYKNQEGLNNLDIVMESNTTSGRQNVWDLHFKLSGKYLPITEFIRDLEDDDQLSFKIEQFNLTPGTSTEILSADFYVREIGTKIDSSITSVTMQNNANTNDTNTTNNTTNTNNTSNANNTSSPENTTNTAS